MMELDPEARDAIRAHNDALDDAQCKVVPLEDLRLGPGHVAKKFIDGAAVPFNDEQIECMALVVWPMQKAFDDMQAETDVPVLPGAHVLAGGSADTPAVLPVR